jgi:hypothetical protein
MVDNLNTQFHDWWSQQDSAGSADDMAQMDFMDEDRGPIGHWPNIENFMKEKYPAAHKGLGMGLEAEWSLDGAAKPYLTGPDAIKQHGYDPSEIAAGMLLLHNQSDPFRGDMAQQDQDRLNDIAQKRFKMQRNYDNRQTQPAAKELVTANRIVREAMRCIRIAAFDQELIDRLRGEYHDWYDENGNEALNWAGRGPLGNWRQIENFMKTKYPAAHRGLNAGQESVMPLLDFGSRVLSPLNGQKDTTAPYETGSEAFKQYGYDPKEVAAGMLLLHNQSHPQRGDMLDYDIDRLSDIAQKRMQMQQNYEQRQPQPITAALDLLRMANRIAGSRIT